MVNFFSSATGPDQGVTRGTPGLIQRPGARQQWQGTAPLPNGRMTEAPGGQPAYAYPAQGEPGAQRPGVATIQSQPLVQQGQPQQGVVQAGQQQQGNPMLAPGLPAPTPQNPFPLPTNPFTGLKDVFGQSSVGNPLGLSAPNPLGIPAPNPFNPLQPFGPDRSTITTSAVVGSWGDNGIPPNVTPYSGGARRPGGFDGQPPSGQGQAQGQPAGSTAASYGGPAHTQGGPVATRPNWNQAAQQYGLRGGYLDQGRGGPYGNF